MSPEMADAPHERVPARAQGRARAGSHSCFLSSFLFLLVFSAAAILSHICRLLHLQRFAHLGFFHGLMCASMRARAIVRVLMRACAIARASRRHSWVSCRVSKDRGILRVLTLMRNRRLIVNPTLARQEQALLRMRLESCRSPAASTDKASAPHSESPALAAVAAGQYLPAVCEPSMVHSPCSDPRPVAANVGDVLAAGRGMERGDVQWWREEEECGDRAGVWKVYMVDGSDNGGQAGAERSERRMRWRGAGARGLTFCTTLCTVPSVSCSMCCTGVVELANAL